MSRTQYTLHKLRKLVVIICGFGFVGSCCHHYQLLAGKLTIDVQTGVSQHTGA